MDARHIKLGNGRMAWCGVPLRTTDTVFVDLDDAEGRLNSHATRAVPCEKCRHNALLMDATKATFGRSQARAGERQRP